MSQTTDTLPEIGSISAIQFTVVVAVHAHSLLAATVTVPVPPAALRVWLEGARSNRHGARCDTRRRSPSTRMSPSRGDDP